MTERPAGRDLRDLLSNPRADRIKQVSALAGRSASSRAAREKLGMFLVEGPQAVRELVRFQPASVRDLFVSEAAQDSNPEIVEEALAEGLFVHPVTDEVARAISTDSQGITATARMWNVSTLELPATARLVAILATVRDPGNAGAVIRAADAAGADLVILAGESVDIFSPKVVRSSAGSLFHLPVVRGVTVAEATAAVRAAGLTVVAADGAGEIEISGTGHAKLAGPVAWLFGNEARGLSTEELALADLSARLPIFGEAESLNLATAAAVCLYTTAFAQRA